ncbi:MAG: MFS transporter [Beijerinckiaceae bacterium]|nr:MFS transporter [Beijerinckiaceae bacterium]
MTSSSIQTAESGQQVRTLTTISLVHLVSHFYWLALVPLLPSLTILLGASYLELGLAITIMNAVSAIIQAPVGFLVDRFGARLLLLTGAIVGALGFILLALVPTYPALIIAAVLIGLGNCVYHPADYSILSAEMGAERMGRAYSIHTFSGYLGFAVAPPVVLLFLWIGGPRFALAAIGITGLLLCLPLIPGLLQERRKSRAPKLISTQKTSALALMTGSVVALTVMFTLVNLSTGMMQTYMVAAVADLLALPQSVGAAALTVFFVALVTGVLVGGFVADRASSVAIVALGGFGLAAMFALAIPVLTPGAEVTLALIGATGFCAGLIMPSRDLLVRKASPPDAVGRVFGIVTTGFNFGGMLSPLIGGALIDGQAPAWIFYGSAGFMLMTVATAIAVERRTVR